MYIHNYHSHTKRQVIACLYDLDLAEIFLPSCVKPQIT